MFKLLANRAFSCVQPVVESSLAKIDTSLSRRRRGERVALPGRISDRLEPQLDRAFGIFVGGAATQPRRARRGLATERRTRRGRGRQGGPGRARGGRAARKHPEEVGARLRSTRTATSTATARASSAWWSPKRAVGVEDIVVAGVDPGGWVAQRALAQRLPRLHTVFGIPSADHPRARLGDARGDVRRASKKRPPRSGRWSSARPGSIDLDTRDEGGDRPADQRLREQPLPARRFRVAGRAASPARGRVVSAVLVEEGLLAAGGVSTASAWPSSRRSRWRWGCTRRSRVR